jgi:hypothetical protein
MYVTYVSKYVNHISISTILKARDLRSSTTLPGIIETLAVYRKAVSILL